MSTQILGVHRVPFEVTIWAKRGEERPDSMNFKNLHLIEMWMPPLPEHLDGKQITQEDPGLNRNWWQVAYEVIFLDTSGINEVEEVVGDRLRLAFFFHFLKWERPLITPHGDVDLPRESAMPDRLKRLVTYWPP